jgi:hypothetical protein
MQYDFPMGECVARCHAYGCAEAIYSYVQKRLAVIGLVVVLVVVVNVSSVKVARSAYGLIATVKERELVRSAMCMHHQMVFSTYMIF